MSIFPSRLYQCRIVVLALIAIIAALPATAQPRLRGMIYNGSSVQDLVDLRATGANVVFYQIVHEAPDIADSSDMVAYMTWLGIKLDVLDTMVNSSSLAGLNFVIVLHTPPGGFKSRKTPALHRLFAESESQQTLVTVWQMIATRYKDKTNVVGFDVLNEPAHQNNVASGLKDWNDLAEQLVQTIRATGATQIIYLEPRYGNPALFKSLKTSLISDSTVHYSFHSYFPTKFRNQGFGGRPINQVYPKGNFNKVALATSVNGAVKFGKKHKVKVICGEFAAPRWAPKNSSFRYLRDYIGIFEKNKWSWGYHAWRESDAWSVEHGSNPKDPNPSATPTTRLKLMKAKFAKNT